MYFTNMLSLRKIGKRLNIPFMAVYKMLNELKEKIKQLYGMDN